MNAWNARVIAVLFTLLIASAFPSGCTSDDAGEFPKLLNLVEDGERLLEEGKDSWSDLDVAFMKCLSNYGNSVLMCDARRRPLEAAYDLVIEKWDFAALKAELYALRMGTGETEAARARSFYLDHLDAWSDWIALARLKLPRVNALSDTFLQTQVASWVEFLVDGGDEISETFKQTCSALGNAQPLNSDEFKSRIIDICDD